VAELASLTVPVFSGRPPLTPFGDDGSSGFFFDSEALRRNDMTQVECEAKEGDHLGDA
jgi:hypothetical protein